MLGGTIPDEDDNDVIAEQLAKISEQMAIKNRRSKKIWKIAGVIFLELHAAYGKRLRNAEESIRAIQKEMDNELEKADKAKSDLYEDYSERLITEEEYMQFSRIYSNEIENIKNRLDVVLAAQVRYSKDYHIEEGWGKVIHTYMSQRKLTKEMADAFVDSIIIHGKYDYEIKLVYDDQFADLQKLKKEKEAQSR